MHQSRRKIPSVVEPRGTADIVSTDTMNYSLRLFTAVEVQNGSSSSVLDKVCGTMSAYLKKKRRIRVETDRLQPRCSGGQTLCEIEGCWKRGEMQRMMRGAEFWCLGPKSLEALYIPTAERCAYYVR